MKSHLHDLPRGSWATLGFFGVFTAVAAAGFAVFGRNPQLLAGDPALLSFYSVSFKFFAQAQVLVGAAVLFYYLTRTARRAWLPALLAAYGASLASELLGTATGLPFGPYEYSSLLGVKWFGLVPLLIPLSWFLMALPAFALSRRRFPQRRSRQLVFGAALLTAWDLALDPAMSSLTNYWSWGEAGLYYGMPLINLLGWMLTGLVIMGLLHVIGAWRWTDRLSPRWLIVYYLITLAMPLGMLAAAGLWPAVAATAVAVGPLLYVALSGQATRRDRRPAVTERRASEDSAYLPAKEFVRHRAEEAGATGAFFSRHSKSFSFAARWYSRQERDVISALYAFCRTTDDMADRDFADDRVVLNTRLDEWQTLVDSAYLRGASGITWLDDILSASKQRGVPLALVHELIDGVRSDLDAVRIQNWKELETYMYRVASVVGIWMCHLFGVTDPWAHRRAAALGQAMQLTNILRDVGEDLEQDRIYLPADFLARYGLGEEDLRTMQSGGDIPAAYRALMHELIGRAEALYEFAAPGLAVLPSGFRRASAVAAFVYRGIHREIRRNGYDNVQQRAATSLVTKLMLAAGGLIDLARVKAEGREPAKVKALSIAKNAVGAITLAALTAWSTPQIGVAQEIAALRPGIAAGSARPEIVNLAPLACPPIADVRNQYVGAVNDADLVAKTLEELAGCESTMHQAYSGALITLKAKHAFWPHKKLKYVRDGLHELDVLVGEHPANVEVRYLRLLSAYFLPDILGRRWSVKEDLKALRELLPGAEGEFPPDLYAEMMRFVEGAQA